MHIKNILLLENIHPVAKEKLEAQGFKVDLLKSALGEQELIEKLKSYDVLGIRSKTQVSEQVIKQSSHLFAIGAFCIGTNQVELKSACENGIPVFNAPYSNTRSVAEMVISEIISLARKISFTSAQLHQGIWNKSAANSYEVRGKKLGIIGYGHIGSQVSVLAESMGMRVLFFDITKKLPLGNSRSMDSLEALLQESDFVSLHVPETEQTKNMITKKQINLMKKSSYLINASRGNVVDISDLAEAIKSKHLAGAAIDVFPEEPEANTHDFKSELQGLENVILTPHIGGSTEEAQEAIGHEVSESFLRYIQAGSTTGAVNFPNVELAISEKRHRVINVHRNVPGVLSEINTIVSGLGVNIEAQYLSTNSQIGYLVMDVASDKANELGNKISNLKTSIKTRVLF